MIYPGNFEQKIGFDSIRQHLVNRCLSPLGEDKVHSLCFSSKFSMVHSQLQQSQEFVRILQEVDQFPTDAYFDLRPALHKVRIEGTFLEEKELFDLRRSLHTLDLLLRFFNQEESGTRYPYLHVLCAEVSGFPQLVKEIDRLLDKFGRIKDQASTQLAKIRKELASTTQSISASLHRILRQAQAEGVVEKDLAPTLRDGRLVIPVSPAFKRKIKGIVHDASATGKTVFIEPAEVVEANNRIRELESEERREIVRILTQFTDNLRPHIPDLLERYDFLGTIDFIRAKALFAIEINALLPALEDKQQIDWAQAIHPLLFLSLRKQGKTVVPLDIELNQEARILIISGPNAGGKSVCLKTVGLLQYMLQCGLLVPMHESSRAGLFHQLFIGIGDEQSIENDLSTYSSHLTNMKHMVKHCGPQSLILIDEFGSGTEPQIGGAIAEVLLKRFNQRASFGVITTHYQNLKHFAENNQGVVNGAMLYDRHHMQALFKLSIGNPGSSFAIEIARKIGLPEDLIAEASDIVGADYIDMDKYLQDIVRDKRYWENKRQNVRRQEKQLEELSLRYQNDLEELEKQRKEWMKQAQAEAKRLLNEANARIENTIKTIRESQAEKEKTKEARQALLGFKENLPDATDENSALARRLQKIENRERKKAQAKPATKSSSKEKAAKASSSRELQVGDAVRLEGQSSAGTVLSIQGKQATVAFGMIKSTLKLEQLQKVSNTQLKKEAHRKASFVTAQTTDDLHERKLQFKPDIDIRGMRGDEALQAVMYFIDDALIVGHSRVRILHGTGTGALRQIVREYLHSLSQVKQYHDEHVQFGGTGITVVELE